MDDLLPLLLSFPPHPPPAHPLSNEEYDRQIRTLLQVLNQTPGSRLIGKIAGGGDLLDILDPSINTLPYLYALLAHINNVQSNNGKQTSNASSKPVLPTGALWPKMVDFLECFDPIQVRYAGHEWRRVVEMVAKSAKAVSKVLHPGN
ncbi:MAG: hypothetical protein M1830_010492 [Pleopsidium flavum]|nr:MAG: hypothetical protein M1830_010492 [Pleopsidium flavum]